MAYTLYIGNKNYSTWSMRPWVVMSHFAIPFNEQLVRFDGFTTDSLFKKTVSALNPHATVPILLDDQLAITDSLAICEYLAEQYPQLNLWPKDKTLRAQARNVVAYMHSGYQHIRQHLPMNIEASLAEVGQILLRDHPELKEQIAFLDRNLSAYLAKSTGRYLFGDFTIADAFYAPMCVRLRTYHITTSASLSNYIDTLYQTKGVMEWLAQALNEKDFVAIDEPYRISR